MSTRSNGERFQMWPRLWPFVRAFVLAALPVPDLISRYRVRRLAARLVPRDPWPGMDATGLDVAKLAVLRLRSLQRDTRRAVRSRQHEASTMLARASIETLITGLYCLHVPGAVAQLQGENVRNLPLLLEYLSDAGMIPVSVLAECIRGLEAGTPAKGPTVEAMARRVDQATGGSTAISLYKAYYRPASTFAVHAGAGSLLLRHVRWDDRITRRPQRTWARRSPVRIADACLGLLAAAVAQQAGTPRREAVRYADRHGGRALTPVMIMGTSGLKRSIGLRNLMTALEQLRSFGDYIQSGADAQNPDVRTAKIREGMKSLLLLAELDIPAGALDPYLDYVAAKIASESSPEPE
jgi:hypothetical protein